MKLVNTIDKEHNYSMIDIWRLIMAYSVISLHSNPLVSCKSEIITGCAQFFWDMINPFFWVTAGYFLFISMNKPGVDKEDKIKNYLYKAIKMYVITTLVSFPLTVYGYIESGNSLFSCVLSYIKYFFFVGKLYNSYHLGFMLNLIYAVSIVLLLVKKQIKEEYIFLIGFLSYTFYEIMYIGILNQSMLSGIFEKAVKVYFFVFNYGAVFSGLVYVGLGLLIAKHRKYLNSWISLIGLIIIQILKKYTGFTITEYMRILEVLFLFMILLNIKLPNSKCYLYIRNMCMLIYLSHLIFLSIYTFLIIGEPNKFGVDTFLVTLVCSTVFAFIVTYFKFKRVRA